MSDSQAYTEVTATREGVTVVKRFEEEEFPIPAIAFEFESDRDESVTVELVDRVPDSVAVEDLGFHPEYGSEHWSIDEDEITFEHELGPRESYTTVYGIRATGTSDVERFLSEPERLTVDPPLDDEATATPAGSLADVPHPEDIADDDDEVVPDFEDESAGAEEDVATLELADPSATASASRSRGTAETAETTEPTDEADDSDVDTPDVAADEESMVPADSDAEAPQGSLVASLAAEIRRDEADDEDVAVLRQALEAAEGTGGSLTARIQRLQRDVSDLRAYTDALEGFLDENGTAQQIIEDFGTDLDELQGKLGRMEARVASNAEDLGTLEQEVGAVREDVDEVTDWMTDVSTEVDEVATDVSDVSETVEGATDELDRVAETVESTSEEVETVRSEVDTVETDVEDVEASLDDLEATVQDLAATVDSLEDDVPDDGMDDQLDTLESEVADLREWQEQIKSTFGGG